MRIPTRQSLVSQCVEILQEGIREAKWRDFLPGELELCRQLKVSRVTLRAALGTLEQQEFLIGGKGKRRRINLKRRRVAKSAATSQVILASSVPMARLSGFRLLWIDHLRDELASQGLDLQFLPRTLFHQDAPGENLRRLAAEHRTAVWILLRASPGAQRWFVGANLPTVVAGSTVADLQIASVDIDYHAACRHAAGLLAARGCERLCLITPRDLLPGDRESEAGFVEGAGARHVSCLRHDGTPDGLRRLLDAMLAQAPTPRGLCVLQSTHAVTVLSHLLKRSCQFPRDFRLISRDDDPFLEHISPTMARYAVAPEAYARRMARTVVALARGENISTVPQWLMPDFIAGETLGT